MMVAVASRLRCFEASPRGSCKSGAAMNVEQSTNSAKRSESVRPTMVFLAKPAQIMRSILVLRLLERLILSAAPKERTLTGMRNP